MITDIQWDKLPDIISCEQLRLTLHMSKRRTAWLLQQQVIKCQISDTNSTWKYEVKKSDLQDFIDKVVSGQLIPPQRPSQKEKRKSALPALQPLDFKCWLEDEWYDIPDLLYNHDVIRITGYSSTAVDAWLMSGKIKSVIIPDDRITTKEWLIDFYATDGYEISRKCRKHTELLKRYFSQK